MGWFLDCFSTVEKYSLYLEQKKNLFLVSQTWQQMRGDKRAVRKQFTE